METKSIPLVTVEISATEEGSVVTIERGAHMLPVELNLLKPEVLYELASKLSMLQHEVMDIYQAHGGQKHSPIPKKKVAESWIIPDDNSPATPWDKRSNWILCWRNRGQRPISYEEAARLSKAWWRPECWLSRIFA